jgi:DNA-binding PadR family transcriptional regulator
MSLRYAALGLLAQQSGSGYDLLKRFETSMANVWPATQSQLYGELNKLAEGGLIEVADIGPRGRKEYRVTTAGRADLLRWMTNPQDDPPYRSTELLRVFLLGEIPHEQARDYLTSVAAHAGAELARLETLRDTIDWSDGNSDFYGRAALEFGLRAEAMEFQWAQWLICRMDERHRSLLVDEGLITAVETDDSKKLFELIDAGREAAGNIAAPPWEEITEVADPGHLNLRTATGQLFGAIAQSAHSANSEQHQRIIDILNGTRRDIHQILGETA